MSDNVVGAFGALVALVLVASLPELEEPATVGVFTVAGAFIGTAIGRWRRLPRERTRELAENWAFAFAAVGIGAYLIANLGGLS